MPIYEYRCEVCGETTAALQKMSDPPLTDCPHDDGGKLVRIISLTNVLHAAGAPDCAPGGDCGVAGGDGSGFSCGSGGCGFGN